jgi:hypothetical protein
MLWLVKVPAHLGYLILSGYFAWRRLRGGPDAGPDA